MSKKLRREHRRRWFYTSTWFELADCTCGGYDVCSACDDFWEWSGTLANVSCGSGQLGVRGWWLNSKGPLRYKDGRPFIMINK